MNYVVIVIILVLAAAFGGYLGSLRAVQLIAEHESKKHRNQGPPPKCLKDNAIKYCKAEYEKQAKKLYEEGGLPK